MTLLDVTTTVAHADQARRLAEAVVQERLAACAQFEPIESVFRWDGAVQHEHEIRVTFKTTVACWPALVVRLRALHPYELPAIHAVAVAHAEADHEAWVDAAVRAPGDG